MALTAVVMSAYQVDLYWPAVPGVQGYRLLRDGHPLATLDAATLFFEDTAVQPAASYDYSVEAFNKANDYSSPSPAASAHTPPVPDQADTQPPHEPVNLTASASDGTVFLTWDDAYGDTDVTAYRIRRNEQLLAAVVTGTFAYEDSTVQPATSYRYSVETFDGAGNRSAPSRPVLIRTPAQFRGEAPVPPSAPATDPPALLLAQGLSDTTIEVTWMPVAGADSYAIYRDDVRLHTQTATLYDDAALQPAATHTYQVAAISSGVESARSTAVSATTLGAHDASQPTQPGPITVSNLSSSSAALQWANSDDNVDVVGYRILRGPVGAPLSSLVQISTTDATNSYTATSLRAGTGYQFAVLALDAAGNLSPARTVTFTTNASSDTTAPLAPSSSSVAATIFSSSRVDLVWGAVSASDLAGYQVFRDGVLVGTIDLPLRRYFSDNGLAPGTRYTYQVRSVDSAGNLSALTTGRKATTTATGVVKIMRGPYLQWTTPNAIRIAWWTNVPAQSTVSYGPGGLTQQVSDTALVRQHVILIAGLNAGTTYTYQVASGSAVSAVSTFTTSVPPGTAFSFAAMGDYGGGSAQQQQVANNIVNSGTRFVQTLGDNVYPDAQDPDFTTTYYDFDGRFYKPEATLIRQQTIWIGNGNKEYYGDGAVWRNFWMPNNERWYSYDWGDAHILVIDTEQPYIAGTPQYQFVQADLAANQSKAWRIVISPKPPFSSATANSSAEGVRAAFAPVFEQQHVQLVLSGDSHNYERSYPLVGGVPQQSGGVTYIISGGGGNGLNQFTIAQPAWSAFRQAIYEHVQISVSPTLLRLDAIRADSGAVFDSLTIAASGGPTATPTPPVPGTATATATAPPSHTPTLTPTGTPTTTPTGTPTNTPTAPAGPTNTPTPTPTASPTSTPGEAATATPSVTPSTTPTATPSPTLTPTPGSAPPIFTDGFESGNLSAWTSNAGLVVQQAQVHSGSFAVEANTTNGITYAKKTLPGTYPDGWGRIYFNLLSYSSQVNLLRLRTAGDGSLAYLFVNTSGKLGLRNDVSATTLTSATPVGSGWHELMLRLVVNGSASTTQVWLDGVPINDLSVTTNLGTTPIGRFQIGEVNSGRTYRVLFDDVVFDTQ